MKLIAAAAVLIVLAVAAPALGQMTEYQRGVANGLKIGLFMGEYYGRGQYVTDYAGQYNTYLEEYNQFLYSSFENNHTLINEFMRWPLSSWPKSSSSGVLKPDATGRILGYPADAYYTAIGAVPGSRPRDPKAALPGV
jgi:opacity protein-like surface antigen